MICKVCTHKFFAYDRVVKVIGHIQATRISMVEGLKNLNQQSKEAQGEVNQEREENKYTLLRLQEAEYDN